MVVVEIGVWCCGGCEGLRFFRVVLFFVKVN